MDGSLTRITSAWKCRKRDGAVVPFDIHKIRRAVTGCLHEINHPGEQRDALTEAIAAGVVAKLAAHPNAVPSVEHVQRLVLQWLWTTGLFDAAEAYQNYREQHRKKRALETACVFDRRVAFKPFEYPDVVKFKNAIQESFWLVSEWSFESDAYEFKTLLSPAERSAITNALLAISQVEVAVKQFWAKLGDRLPKPEFVQVGIVFAESEIRHSDAYSNLLEVMGLNDEFGRVATVPALSARVDYLSRHLRSIAEGDDRSFAKTLALFSLFVENVSLFSQFAVVKSFAKHRKVLNKVDNVVQATQLEEQLHALFGMYVVNLVRSERPEWFGPAFYEDLCAACREAVEAETRIVDWIFEAGDLDFVPRAALVEFIKDRMNDGIAAIGGPAVFKVDRAALAPLTWFVEELHGQIDVDFFWKKSVGYDRGGKPITADDLF